jgi:hypothetical protein
MALLSIIRSPKLDSLVIMELSHLIFDSGNVSDSNAECFFEISAVNLKGLNMPHTFLIGI